MVQNIRLSLRSYLCLCLCVCPPVDPLHSLNALLLPSQPLSPKPLHPGGKVLLPDEHNKFLKSLSYNSIAWTDFMNIQNCLSLNQVCSWENNCQLLVVVVEKVSVVEKGSSRRSLP